MSPRASGGVDAHLGLEVLVWWSAELIDGSDAGVLPTEESHPPDILGNRRYPESP